MTNTSSSIHCSTWCIRMWMIVVVVVVATTGSTTSASSDGWCGTYHPNRIHMVIGMARMNTPEYCFLVVVEVLVLVLVLVEVEVVVGGMDGWREVVHHLLQREREIW